MALSDSNWPPPQYHWGADVTVLEAADRLSLGRAVPAEIAELVHARHDHAGVTIRCAVALSGIAESDHSATLPALSDGTSVDCDVLIVGVGAVLESALAEKADLDVENGIKVDARLASLRSGQYSAAGDCWRRSHIRCTKVAGFVLRRTAQCRIRQTKPYARAQHDRRWPDLRRGDARMVLVGPVRSEPAASSACLPRPPSRWCDRDPTACEIRAMASTASGAVGVGCGYRSEATPSVEDTRLAEMMRLPSGWSSIRSRWRMPPSTSSSSSADAMRRNLATLSIDAAGLDPDRHRTRRRLGLAALGIAVLLDGDLLVAHPEGYDHPAVTCG